MAFVDGMKDLEAIEYCIEMGIEEARGLLKTYETASRFTNMKSVQSLQKLLATIHFDVELAINPKTNKPFTGQKRRHLVGDLRIEKVKKDDGRENNSRKPTADDLILDEFIFNELVKLNGGNRPLSSWVSEIDLYNLYHADREEMKSLIEDLHSEGMAFFNPANAVNKFYDVINNRNTSIVKNAFNRLSQSERIETTTHYIFKNLEDKYITVSLEQYEEVRNEVKEIVEEHGLNYRKYVTQRINSQYTNPEYYECQKEVKEFLEKNHEIQYFYSTLEVTINNKTVEREVAREEMEEAYFNRLISLTLQKQKRKEYQDTRFVEKEFYRLNTLALLDYLEVIVPKEIIEEDLFSLKERSEQVYSNNFNYHWEMNEKRRAEEIKNSAF